MKICYVCLFSPWAVKAGGGQIITHKIASKMAELGHTVYVVYTRTKDMLPAQSVNYNIVWTHHFERDYLNIFSVFFALIKILGKEKFDIINAIEGEAVLLAPFLNKKMVYLTTTHSPFIPDITGPSFFRHPARFVKHIKRYIRYYFIKMSMQVSRFVIVPSYFSVQNAAQALGIPIDKFKMIPNGIDEEFFNYTYDKKTHDGKKNIVCVARLDDQKGIDILIKALPYVLKRQDVNTTIVGTGWKEEELKALASSLGLLDKINFVGRVAHEDVYDYISKADLFVLPSRRDLRSLAILEAMAMGVPPVATPIGGIPEIIRNDWNGVLVKQEDPQALSNAIIDLLKDDKKREYLSRNGKRYVSDNFTWDIIASKYNTFYESLLTNTACPICYSNKYKIYLVRNEICYLRCNECNMVYLKDVPSDEALAKFYSSDFFNEDINTIIKDTVERKREQLKMVESLLPAKGRLLDIGCGHGYFLKEAKDQGWEVHGLDISPSAKKFVKQTTGIDIFLGNIEEAHYRDSYFDVVTLWDVLEHTPDPFKILKEVWRIVKKGGIVATSTPNARGINAICYKDRWPYYDFKKYGHILQFSPDTLKKLLKRSGFKMLQTVTKGSLDIRYIPNLWGVSLSNKFILYILDKSSGLAAKLSEPLKFGNTIFLWCRKV